MRVDMHAVLFSTASIISRLIMLAACWKLTDHQMHADWCKKGLGGSFPLLTATTLKGFLDMWYEA